MNALVESGPRGRKAITAMFERSANQGRAAFLPYYPVGYPNYEESLTVMNVLAEAGVDGMEIGIPFSDPLADGPTIQAATQQALEGGTTVASAIEAVIDLRTNGHQLPLFLMSYLNPILAFGSERFILRARDSGADGVIIPDLPPEEAGDFITTCEAAELALVFFAAPTSSESRIQLVATYTSGFIYVVSLTGTTGARTTLPEDLPAFIERLRMQCDQPLVLGFGISNALQARQLDGLLDGFIVGSAMIDAAKLGPAKASQFARSIIQRNQSQEGNHDVNT